MKSSTVLVVPGDNFIALATIRSLGRQGVRVVAMCSPDGIGCNSRYCWKRCALPEEKSQIIEAVMSTVQKYRITHIIPTGEALIQRLNAHRDLLANVILLFPDANTFDKAMYKDRTLATAQLLGIDVPYAIDPAGPINTFPIVVKPRHQNIHTQRQGFKFRYVRSRTELEQLLAACSEPPLIQEYIGGYGIGLSVLMGGGEPLLTFQHRRIREVGGVSVYCESVPIEPDLAAQSVSLLRAMKWEGVAMVEYRRDPNAGRTVLMEVNGRLWGSLPLAIHAGADFPYQLYMASNGSPLNASQTYRRVRCRSLAGDTKWLLSHPDGFLAYLRAFSPSTRYFAWSWHDPLPSIRNALLRLRRLWIRVQPYWMTRTQKTFTRL